MKLPPWLVRFGYQSWTFWLPLVLLWPLLLVLFMPLLFLSLFVGLIVDGASPRAALRVIAGVFQLLCELRGTEISLRDGDFHVRLAFY